MDDLTDPTPGQLFISYATEDKAKVDRYCRNLEEEGVAVWLDRNEIAPSDDLVRRINHGIATSRYAVLFHSERYAAKPWTMAEHDAIINAAVVGQDRRVFVVRLDDTPLPSMLAGKLWFAAKVPAKDVARQIAGVIRHDVIRHDTKGPSAPPAPAAPPTVAVADLPDVTVEALAELLLSNGLGRMTRGLAGPTPEVTGYLYGVGTVRVRVRGPAVTLSSFGDFETVAEIACIHKRYIGELNKDLAKGGLVVFKPAYVIHVEEKTEALAGTRHTLRGFLRGFVERIEVLEPVG